MRVTVRTFAALREALGGGSLDLELPDGATVGEAVAALAARAPRAGPLLERSACAVNARYAARGERLSSGDELALIPPVSGG